MAFPLYLDLQSATYNKNFCLFNVAGQSANSRCTEKKGNKGGGGMCELSKLSD